MSCCVPLFPLTFDHFDRDKSLLSWSLLSTLIVSSFFHLINAQLPPILQIVSIQNFIIKRYDFLWISRIFPKKMVLFVSTENKTPARYGISIKTVSCGLNFSYRYEALIHPPQSHLLLQERPTCCYPSRPARLRFSQQE